MGNPTSSQTSNETNPLIQAAESTPNEGVCYYDWKELNRSTDSSGYSNVSIKLYLKNDATRRICTQPDLWCCNVNGQLYNVNGEASSNISMQENNWATLVKGGEAEVRFNFRVKGTHSIDDVVYSDVYTGPKMQRIKHY